MKNQQQGEPSPLKKIARVIDRIDQNIEEWIHHFINQIDQESYHSKENDNRV